MDTLTHIVLGATTGDALLGKKLGKKAMLIGAIAQIIPDLDFIAYFWTNPSENLLAHRGFTHSLLFLVIVTLFLAALMFRFERRNQLSFKKWSFFIGFEIAIHLFVDVFNAYGTGLLEPFSHQRFSLHTMFVADPFFSFAPAIAAVVLFLKKRNARGRAFWQKFGIIIPLIYLGYCSVNKTIVDGDVKKILSKKNINHQSVLTTPTPLNNWLWYIAVKSDSGFYIGYRSVFDRNEDFEIHYFPQEKGLLESVADKEEMQKLIRFSQGYYVVQQWHDTIVFNDLRFGQIVGWHDPKEHFVFHYFLQEKGGNEIVLQRGRFAKWDLNTLQSLWRRIKGN